MEKLKFLALRQSNKNISVSNLEAGIHAIGNAVAVIRMNEEGDLLHQATFESCDGEPVPLLSGITFDGDTIKGIVL